MIGIRGLLLGHDEKKIDANAAHALVQNQSELGAATAVLPLVSTLVFGFAVSALLGDNSLHPSVVVLLAISASTSLWVVTFSVLESYYTKMASYAEEKAFERLQADGAKVSEEGMRSYAARLEAATHRFDMMRSLARQFVWLSLILIMTAIAVDTFVRNGAGSWLSFAMLAIIVLATLSVPLTVVIFRVTYRPLLTDVRDALTNTKDSPSTGSPDVAMSV